MAAYRSSSGLSYASRTNATVTAPAGIQDGDVLVLYCGVGSTTGITATPPSGFASLSGITNPLLVTDGTFSMRNYLWYKVATSESGNYTITHASASSTAFMVAVSAGDTTAAPACTTNSGTSTTTTALSLTTSNNNAYVLFLSQDWGDSANTLTAPTGSTPTFTKEFSSGLVLAADGVLATAGATGNKTCTNNSFVPNPWSGYLVKVETAPGPTIGFVPSGTALTTPAFTAKFLFFDTGDYGIGV